MAALYALLSVTACQDGNEGMTTGGETGGTEGLPPVDGCYPDWDETGGEDPEGFVSVCSGSGNGWIRSIIYITGPDPKTNAITRYNCVQPPLGVDPEDVTEAHCIANPIDLETLADFSGGVVANPEVCCTEAVDLPDIATACKNDCAHAACRLAVLKLEQAAAAAEVDTAKADIIGFGKGGCRNAFVDRLYETHGFRQRDKRRTRRRGR